MKQSQLKSVIKAIIRESMTTRAELDAGTMKAVNLQEENWQLHKVEDWERVHRSTAMRINYLVGSMLTAFRDGSGEERAAQAAGTIREILNELADNGGNMKEETGTGAVAGYQTPFAFKKKMNEMRQLSVPEKHQLRIALQTLRAPDAMVGVMGGMNKEEAREFLKKLGYSDVQIVSIESQMEEHRVNEETGTGAVAGYQTPFAFSKNKSGSKRAVDATKKLGYKVVGPTPRV